MLRKASVFMLAAIAVWFLAPIGLALAQAHGGGEESMFGIKEIIQLGGAVAIAAFTAVGTAWAMRGAFEKRASELTLAVEKVLQRVDLLAQRWELLGQGTAEKLERLEKRLDELEKDLRASNTPKPRTRSSK